MDTYLTYLRQLESESIYILREAYACFDRPVMLYSTGKDSSVMLHLAQKAFYPEKIPFPVLHIDTGWKFKEMIAFRERRAKETGFDLLVYMNREGVDRGINPFVHGSEVYTRIMKTEALRKALTNYKFDGVIGGARRDEEKSRAKERIFSYRNEHYQWDPKNQRPELWNIYNTKIKKGESIRIFPLSNWTELDIWRYILLEKIPVVSLYFACERPVVARNGILITVDDERMHLLPGERIQKETVRFRTLGCYPLTGAIRSTVCNLEDMIEELTAATMSERQGRLIDFDITGSMEEKKREGYF